MSAFTAARVGQVNGGGSADALFLKVFSGEVLTTFDVENVASNLHMVRTISSGKSAQFPVAGQVTASYHTPGAEIAGQAVNHNEKLISIDDLLIAPVFIPNIDEAKNHYDYRSIYSTECGRALAREWDKRVLRTLVLNARAAATITGQSGGSVIATLAMDTDPAVLKASIAKAAQKLDEKNVPAEGRYVVLKPAQYWLLVSDATIGSILHKDFGGSGSIASGKAPMYAGIEIVKSNNLPAAAGVVTPVTGENNTYSGDFTKTVGLVGHKSAAGTVKLMDLATESEYSVRHQGTLIVAKYAMGTGGLRPESTVELALP